MYCLTQLPSIIWESLDFNQINRVVSQVFLNLISIGGVSYEIFCLVTGILAFLIPISLQVLSSLNKDYYSSGLAEYFYSEKLFFNIITVEKLQSFSLFFALFLISPKALKGLGVSYMLKWEWSLILKAIYILSFILLVFILIVSTFQFLACLKRYSLSKQKILERLAEDISNDIQT